MPEKCVTCGGALDADKFCVRCCEYSEPCRKCGRTDLPLHTDYLCPNCHPLSDDPSIFTPEQERQIIEADEADEERWDGLYA